MADSVLFSFSKVDDFLELMIDNDNITTSLFDGTTKNFRIVLAEACPDNINECLTNQGTLNTSVMSLITGTDTNDGTCALLWTRGVNTNRMISLSDSSVHWNLNDEIYLLKGAFLILNQTGEVLAYSINNAPISVKSEITMPMDGMIWSIHSKVYEGD